MDSIRQVEGELKRSELKVREFKNQSINNIEHATQLAQQIKDELEQLNNVQNPDAAAADGDAAAATQQQQQQRIQDKLAQVKKICKDYGEAHRDIHPTVSRIGRVIDKCFTPDLMLFAEPAQPLTTLDVIDSEQETPTSRLGGLESLRQFFSYSTGGHPIASASNLESFSALLQQFGASGNVLNQFLAQPADVEMLPPPSSLQDPYSGLHMIASSLSNAAVTAAAFSNTRREAAENDSSTQQQQSPTSTAAAADAEQQRKREANNERMQSALCHALVEHCYRQGMIEVGDQLCREAKIDFAAATTNSSNNNGQRRDQYIALNNIVAALRRVDLQPALEWAEQNADGLNKIDSLFELKLHRFRFIQLLASGRRSELLAYVRVFSKFKQPEQLREVQTLMGNLMFVPKDLQDVLNQFEVTLQPTLLGDLCDTFIHDACQLQNMPTESPVSIALKVGCQAIGPLLTFHNAVVGDSTGSTGMLMGSTTRSGGSGGAAAIWDASRPELPVEIARARDYMFHSVFVCPILRQPTSSKNPPMRLVCGHAISSEALNKLSHQMTSTRFMCPYCPKEQDPKEAKKLQF